MVNITFLIGNGFDIGLGLKTSYKDFYEYLMKNEERDNMIVSQIEQDKLAERYDKWSDLELALGQYTENVTEETYKKFARDKARIDKLLLKYLQEERKKISFDGVDLSEDIINALMKIREWRSKVDRKTVQATLNAYKDEGFNYKVINFNYTDCIDCFFKMAKKKGTVIGTHKVGNLIYNEAIGEVLHIHGELDGSEMILGVNDETQIKNSSLLEVTNIKELLVKPRLNEIIGQDKISEAERIIDESGIICLYGVSIGDTDKMWWEYIGRWLKSHPRHLLIIYDYNAKYDALLPYEEYEYKSEQRKRFWEKTGIGNLSEGDRKNIEDRILVGVNRNIFNFTDKITVLDVDEDMTKSS